MPDGIRRSCVVIGRVQGVGFRAFVLSHATRRGLTGRVRNGADGRSVEITVEGPAGHVEEFLAAIEHGPPLSHVEAVRTASLDGPARYRTFEIEH
jgi:acylphosphatase